MKKILLILLSISIFSCTKTDKQLLNEYDLIGNVESIKKIHLNYNINTSKFDTISIENLKFNSINKKIKGEFTTYFSNNIVLNIKSDLFYNSKGDLISENSDVHNLGDINFKTYSEYIYLNNKLDRIESFIKEKKSKQKRIIQIEKIIYKDGIINKSIERDFEIDEKINDTICVKTTKKKYDKNERIIEIDWNTIDNKVGKYEFVRNMNGLTTETKIYKNNNQDFDISKFRYEFDKNGNWILQSEFISDTLKSIRKRLIIYK